MQGFSNLLKANFGDSATPLNSPLEPRLKVGQDAATAPSPPASFDTPKGDRRLPRDKDPKKPSYEMIKDARQGVLSGFLRSGTIFRASDFIGMVNPKTAVITLNDIYDFETRCLTPISDRPIAQPPMSSIVSFRKTPNKGADDEKTLRNLYYISLNQDELPSFHFWTKSGDLDPVTVGGSFDKGKYSDKTPPLLATIAKTAMLENERTRKAQHGASQQQGTQDEQSLGFLDRYNDIGLPSSSKEPTDGRPASDTDPISQIISSQIPAQPPIEAEVLLQFNRGGMYLREYTHRALYTMSCWLVKNEDEDEEPSDKYEEEVGPTEPEDIFLDILEPGKILREERIVSVSRVSNRNFREKIRPFFGQPGNKFRIRSTKYQSSWNLDSSFDSGGVGDLKYDLKLVRPNVGYCYCSANWHITGNLVLNSVRFEKAIRFLFDWESSPHPKSNHLSLEIPEHGSFDLHRNSDVVVDAKIQKIFAEISTPAEAYYYPAEIFIRDVPVDDTDGSDPLGTSQHTGHDPMEAIGIRRSLNLSSIQPKLLTTSEISKLQERLRIAEASIVESDDLQEQLRTLKGELSEMIGLKERLQNSEDRARRQQRDHLKLHQRDIVHQPAEQQCPQPGCPTLLGENQTESTYEAIAKHLQLHIERGPFNDGICSNQGCYTNMYSLTIEQQYEHELAHDDNEKIKEERDQLLERVRNLEGTSEQRNQIRQDATNAGSLEVMAKQHQLRQEQGRHLEKRVIESDRLQREVESLQDAAKKRDQLQQDLVRMADEYKSLQNRASEMERRLEAVPGLEKGTQTKEIKPGTEAAEDPKQPNQPEASRLQYCNVCLKSVDKLSADARAKHAEKCETSVSEFALFRPAEAKAEREKRNKSRDVVTPQVQKGTARGEEVPGTGKKGKQKKATPSESQQDEVENDHTNRQSEGSKATGRRTLKRKNDTFKPSNEDESEDDEPASPTKKAKRKAKAVKKDRETAPTRRSTRGNDIYQPPIKDDEPEEEYDEPSSSAKGGKRKERAAAATRVSKKAKTKK